MSEVGPTPTTEHTYKEARRLRPLIIIAICVIALAAVTATNSGRATAQQQDPVASPTPTATTTPTATPTATPTPADNTPEQVPGACPGWPAFSKKLAKQPFTVGKLRGNASVSLVNGKLTLSIVFQGRRLSGKAGKLTLRGKLTFRTIEEHPLTKHTFRAYSGMRRLKSGTKSLKWTFTKKWCSTAPTTTEVWKLFLSARFNGVKVTGSDPLIKPFVIEVPAPVS
jgi:hypothetical protein